MSKELRTTSWARELIESLPFLCGLGKYFRKFKNYAALNYSLRSELLVSEMDVSRRILVLDTSISATSNSERRE